MSGSFQSQSVRGLIVAIYLTVLSLHNGSVFAQESPSPSSAKSVSVADHVTEASQRFGIPEHWIYAVMKTESRGRILAVSPAGAMGLMQIMPATWASLRARYRLGNNAYDPRDNIHAGTAYLREMYDQFGTPGFLAAYNAGPGRYLDYVRNGRVLPAETRAYVAKIMPMIANGSSRQLAVNVQQRAPLVAKPIAVHWAQSGLFPSQNRQSDSVLSPSTFSPLTADNIVSGVQAEPVSHNLFANISARTSR